VGRETFNVKTLAEIVRGGRDEGGRRGLSTTGEKHIEDRKRERVYTKKELATQEDGGGGRESGLKGCNLTLNRFRTKRRKAFVSIL